MFSIITPTYNRSHTLHRVYQSLLNQTYNKFQWIIVDDFSSDNTNLLVNKWISDKKMDIKYYKLSENQGKSSAVNFGLKLCKEPYTIIADSDDSFEPTTLEELKLIWTTISLTIKNPEVASVWTLTKDEKNDIVGDKFPKDFWQVGFEERVLKNNIKGEKWASWKTSILSNVQMYAQKNVNVGESHTWNRINRNYDFVCLNIVHRTYYDSADGMISTKVSNWQNARRKFYSSYYALFSVDVMKIIKHPYYWELMFNYVSSKFYFNDKLYNLGTRKNILAVVVFIIKLPFRLLKKIK